MKHNNYIEEQRYVKAKKRVDNIKGFYIHAMVYVLVNLFISGVVIFGLTREEDLTLTEAITHPGVFMTWLGWGIGLFFHWLGVFGFPSFISKDWEERKIKELMDQDEKQRQEYLNK